MGDCWRHCNPNEMSVGWGSQHKLLSWLLIILSTDSRKIHILQPKKRPSNDHDVLFHFPLYSLLKRKLCTYVTTTSLFPKTLYGYYSTKLLLDMLWMFLLQQLFLWHLSLGNMTAVLPPWHELLDNRPRGRGQRWFNMARLDFQQGGTHVRG